MPNYVPVGPWHNNAGPAAVNAAFLTALEAVLKQPSGGGESGKHALAGSVYTSGALVSQHMATLSRTSVPVSVTVDTADLAPTGGLGGPSTNFLSSGGFQMYNLGTTGPNVNARCAGNWTVTW